MRYILQFLLLTAIGSAFAQSPLPDTPHTKKLLALVAQKIWFTPNIGCLDKISLKLEDGRTSRIIPSESIFLEIKELLYKDVIGYRFLLSKSDERVGETDSNLLVTQLTSPPFNANSYFKTCFFAREPGKIAEELKSTDAIGFTVYKGYSTEGRAREIDRLADFDKFLFESARKDLERAKKPGVQIGMTKKQVREQSSWGEPLRINTTITKNGESEQWVYGDGQYLYFTRGVLTSIQR